MALERIGAPMRHSADSFWFVLIPRDRGRKA
jgi:hypothetical protein